MTDLDALLKPLREEYEARLPEHLTSLDDLLLRQRAGQDAREGLRDLCHRLRGTAGTYGLPEVGDALGAIDDLLTSRRGAPRLPDGDVDRIAQLLTRARAAYDHRAIKTR